MTAIRCSIALDKPVVLTDGVAVVVLVAVDATAIVVVELAVDATAAVAVVTSCCDAPIA